MVATIHHLYLDKIIHLNSKQFLIYFFKKYHFKFLYHQICTKYIYVVIFMIDINIFRYS